MVIHGGTAHSQAARRPARTRPAARQQAHRRRLRRPGAALRHAHGARAASVRALGDPAGPAGARLHRPVDPHAERMTFSAITPHELRWMTRPHDPGEPARHVAELSELAGFAHTRANLWRYEPGARGLRHRHPAQEETFVPVNGTLTMYVDEPPERRD